MPAFLRRSFATSIPRTKPARAIDPAQFPPERIRSVSIIAHIDHGKSTLADRMLEITGTIPQGAKQVLDKLAVERERGITVKAASVSMLYPMDSEVYLINLLDTPGHVDFASEVHRSLVACQGAILLVDASQGIQAQTLSVFSAAKNQAGIEAMFGVANKVDLPHANVPATIEQIEGLVGKDSGDVLCISAKTGMGVEAVLRRIVEAVPPPTGSPDRPLRALVYDSYFDAFRGVVSYIVVVDGALKKGDRINFMTLDRPFEITDIGVLHPDEVSTSTLRTGQSGWMTCGMKSEADSRPGDTIFRVGTTVEPLASFKPLQPMAYSAFFPVNAADHAALHEAINRLMLTDRAITCEHESSAALGQGFRLGFLGALHMDVARQRLDQEFDADTIVTRPFVPVRVVRADGEASLIRNPADYPNPADMALGSPDRVVGTEEAIVEATVVVPEDFAGSVMDLASSHRGRQKSFTYVDEHAAASSGPKVQLTFDLPLAAVVSTFHSQLKSISSGFATLEYSEATFQRADLVKLNILVDKEPVDALCSIVHRDFADREGRETLARLKEHIPRQQYEIVLQAAAGNKVIARERIQAYRKVFDRN